MDHPIAGASKPMISISDEEKLTYAAMWVLKMMDLEPKKGGLAFPVTLPHTLVPFEPVLEALAVDGLIELHRRSGMYRLTPAGVEYLGALIDEAESYIEEFDDMEVDAMVPILRRRNVDLLRVRFLWGWYQGEFDDPVLFQQRRGQHPVERDAASYLLSDAFFVELLRDYDAPN